MIVKLNLDDIREMVLEVVTRIMNEDVYADTRKINRKKKQIGLTYKKTRGSNLSNNNYFDYLGTDFMQQDNGKTYEVMLKGGITSYNITDIKGSDVMHYFKHKWDGLNSSVSVKGENSEDKYELIMQDDEFMEFMKAFKRKVEFVIKYWLDKNKTTAENFTAVSIYPVPSSSRFNTHMAELLSRMQVYGLPVQVINQALLQKDLRNLQKDNEFIEKNKEYYEGQFIDGHPEQGSVINRIDTTINKYGALSEVDRYLPKINDAEHTLLSYYYRNQNGERLTPLIGKRMANVYKSYYDNINRCYNITYQNLISQKISKVQRDKVLQAIKYTKGPSVETRSPEIWNMVKPFLRGQISPVTNKPYTQIDIYQWSRADFEIKNLSNPERMGLKNIYNPNTDTEMVNKELERIKGTVFVIFDDNISGGATLGDICYQCKNMGIKNIIPITFGKMSEKWTMGFLPINTPKNNRNDIQFNF